LRDWGKHSGVGIPTPISSLSSMFVALGLIWMLDSFSWLIDELIIWIDEDEMETGKLWVVDK
jgi:hypothetical protein